MNLSKSIMILFLFIGISVCNATSVATTQSVSLRYPSLASGALTHATLVNLPDGIILQSGSIQITDKDLEAAVAKVPPQIREEMKRNLFFLLEQQATESLLVHLSESRLGKAGVTPQEINAKIQQYLEKSIGEVQVTDDEVARFYDDNKDMCGGATLDQIKGELKQYVLDQKKQEAATEYIRSLGKLQPILVSSEWTAKQAEIAMDNPVEKARRSGKPSLVDFGAAGCRPCDMMEPILEKLKTKYEGKANVVFIHVREQQILSARYGIQSIPVQILYDKDGREVWRHMGYIPQEQIEEQFKKVGIQ